MGKYKDLLKKVEGLESIVSVLKAQNAIYNDRIDSVKSSCRNVNAICQRIFTALGYKTAYRSTTCHEFMLRDGYQLSVPFEDGGALYTKKLDQKKDQNEPS